MENPGCCSTPVHDKKWILQHSSAGLSYNLCFACAILNLENDRQFTVYKRLILSELVDILRKIPRIIEIAVENEDKVIMHASMVLLGLSCGKDERLAAPASECLLLFLFHTKKEAVELAVTQRMTVEIQEEENYLQTLPQLRLLGGLFQLLPEIIEKTLTDNGKFLQFVVNGMTYPSEEVKSAVVYLLIQIFSADSRTSDDALSATDRLIVSGILSILTHDQKKDLTKNTLALLKVFLSKEPRRFGMFFENSSKTSDFSVIIKKMILSPDSSFQVSIIQTLCHILSDSSEYENHVHLLLAANIPELLFEAVCIKNDLLIETILCCLVLMSHYSLFFKTCHNIYGMTTILDVSHHLLSVRNWRLLCVAFNFLTRMASSDQCLSSGSIRCSLFQQSIKLVEKAFKVRSTTVLLAAGRFFIVLLMKRNLPTPFPLSSILHVVHSCLKDMSAFFSPTSHSDTYSRKHIDNINNLPTDMKILMSGLDIIYYSLRIAKDDCSNTITEDAFSCPGTGNVDEIQQESYKKRIYVPLMNISLSSLDEIFIPYCLHLDSKAHVGQIIWFHVFKVLSILFEDNADDELLFAFAKKILKVRLFKHLWDVKMNETYLSNCDFVDVKDVCNQCLKNVLHCFLKKSDPSDTYMETVDSGIVHLDCSFQECAYFLSQKCDVTESSSSASSIASAQVAFLCLCYISFTNEEMLIDVKLLIPHLAYYITCNYETFNSSEIIVKHLIYIIAVCMYECVSKGIKLDTGLSEANGLLWTLMSKLSSYSLIYTHHKVLLWWCFRNDSVNPFCSYVLQMWLESSMETENHDVNILLHLLCLNKLARKTYMDLFDLTSPIQSRIAFSFLKKAYECEVYQNTAFSEKMDELISDLVQHIHVSLTRLFIIKNYGEKQSNG
ncbi:meiosis inhibitor protein 1-like, partial [Stegodyphus dumicola]|uniref:meiosis inhibitor protein 1-like n=1 Tax=Stegodyphus dumicola TaxID=202533 RepID=UPI0015A8DAB8